jgi:hypothetical protein
MYVRRPEGRWALFSNVSGNHIEVQQAYGDSQNGGIHTYFNTPATPSSPRVLRFNRFVLEFNR